MGWLLFTAVHVAVEAEGGGGWSRGWWQLVSLPFVVVMVKVVVVVVGITAVCIVVEAERVVVVGITAVLGSQSGEGGGG